METIALLPIIDASANPPGLRPDIDVIEIPAQHGLLIDDPVARHRVIEFFRSGRRKSTYRWDYALIQSLGVAWQNPALKTQLNPVWDTVVGIPTAHHNPRRCLPQ